MMHDNNNIDRCAYPLGECTLVSQIEEARAERDEWRKRALKATSKLDDVGRMLEDVYAEGFHHAASLTPHVYLVMSEMSGNWRGSNSRKLARAMDAGYAPSVASKAADNPT